jgi:hypothetical protein
MAIRTLMAILAVLSLLPQATADQPNGPQRTTEIAVAPETEKPSAKPRIEIALLLDTSGSMSGLINQARTKLWKIVNEFEIAKRNGQRADVYVALYEYGNDGLVSESGYVRQIVPLTLDLDRISEELFALSTNGGSEYCGQVINCAVRDLKWSDTQTDLRCIFIAGNEPFTQGPVPYTEACHAAANKKITVSTIHCGGYDEGVSGMWADGAKLADGSYMHIDHNQAEPHIPAPQDDELAALNTELNATYCAYGAAEERAEAAERQVAQDANAANAAPAAAASRIATKAGRLYRNASWDLVDAVRENKLDLGQLDKEQLPETLRQMSADELAAHVEMLASKRAAVQTKIKALAAERAKFVAAERAKLAGAETPALDEAIIETVRDQATRQEFEFATE